MKSSSISLAIAAAIAASVMPQTSLAKTVVRVEGTPGAWHLSLNGKPFFVTSAAGSAPKKMLAAIGGNAARTWGAGSLGEELDDSLENGLMLMAGFWLGHADEGFDYTDEAALEAVEKDVAAKVAEFKDHDALLCWALGNEMELGNPHRQEMWRFIDRLAVKVKEIDPDHPVCTVVAEIPENNLAEFDALAPHLDFLGINSYAGCGSLGERWRKAGMKRPYLVTEFGARGSWEGPSDQAGLPLEQTSTEKGVMFAESYAKGAAAERGKFCLGAFAFTWGWKVEATPTWHGMLLPGCIATASVEAMQKAWGKVPISNHVPEIEPISCRKTVLTTENEIVEASVSGRDQDGDALQWRWVLLSDTGNYGSVGASLPMPEGWDEAIVSGQGTTSVRVRLPGGGAYRLYAYCFDGKAGAAYASVPLSGPGEKPKPKTPALQMPAVVYSDASGPWIPSGYMGNTRALKVDKNCSDNPFEGRKCMRIDYLDHIGWAGIFWQSPANDWGEKPGGFDLKKASTLVFRARGLRGGEKVTFFMGGLKNKPFSDSAEAKLQDIVLKKDWTRYRIPLDGLDLGCIKTGFGFTVANDGEPFTFFLDDIKYVAD